MCSSDLPWEAAILPQMNTQLAAVPLHALGYPDALNVVSLLLAATLAWFAFHIVRGEGRSTAWAWICVAVLGTGMYPAVLQVTGGSQAMGDLALAVAVVALVRRQSLCETSGTSTFVFCLSLLTVAAATSKVTLLPVSAVILLAGAWIPLRQAVGSARGRLLAVMLGPWLLCHGPLVLWTWLQSGAPYGPILSHWFPQSLYDPQASRESFEYTRMLNQPGWRSALGLMLVNSSPLLWLAAISALLGTQLLAGTRVLLGAVMGLQLLLVGIFVAHDPRFLGGLPQGLAIVFAAWVRPGWPGIRAKDRKSTRLNSSHT